MKIRAGFVSNSSTSSFCVLGVMLNKDEFFRKLADILDAKLEAFAVNNWSYNRSNMDIWAETNEAVVKGYELDSGILVGFEVDGRKYSELVDLSAKLTSVLEQEPSVHGWGYYDG